MKTHNDTKCSLLSVRNFVQSDDLLAKYTCTFAVTN